ncbi:MAG: phosphate signaling complex protein PhoU [Pseudomonadota bacterium]|nr:phosphate signaling complex protein PhoU [Pseudomonadota bacterium]
MQDTGPHIMKAFDDDIEQVRAHICEMGGLAEAAINKAIDAISSFDETSAAAVVADDARIDRMSEEIERQCIRLIALRAPRADDLREVLAAFKIAVMVERMGDNAANIARQVRLVCGFGARPELRIFSTISASVADMVSAALDAYVRRDVAGAKRIYDDSAAVDMLHDQLFRSLLAVMSKNPSTISACTRLLFVSQSLDRIGDHARNIARLVVYIVTGEQMPHYQALDAEAAQASA